LSALYPINTCFKAMLFTESTHTGKQLIRTDKLTEVKVAWSTGKHVFKTMQISHALTVMSHVVLMLENVCSFKYLSNDLFPIKCTLSTKSCSWILYRFPSSPQILFYDNLFLVI
jgi:hypothetical protein